MKSLSLDSPESTELHGQMRRRYPGGGGGVTGGGAGGGVVFAPPPGHNYHGGSGGALEHTPPSNNSRLHCKCGTGGIPANMSLILISLPPIVLSAPSSPSQQQRRLLYANRLKTGSVDLPDEVDKSLSSASTSPCPSPVRQNQVIHFCACSRI